MIELIRETLSLGLALLKLSAVLTLSVGAFCLFAAFPPLGLIYLVCYLLNSMDKGDEIDKLRKEIKELRHGRENT